MDWRELVKKFPQIFDSLWLFPKRGIGGDKRYHGGFIPQIPEYLIMRYTNPGDHVADFFAGSGTTGDVAKRLGRHCFMSDLVPYREDTLQADARTIQVGVEMAVAPLRVVPTLHTEGGEFTGPFKFDLTILHPPYADIIQFSDHPDDLSNCPDLPTYLEEMWKAAVNIDHYVKVKGHIALVLGDIYKDGQVVPLAFLIMQQWRVRLPYALKAVYIKDIQGNVKDNKTNLWRYRHLKFGTNFFKHEYVFVFRKERERSKNDSVLW